MIPRSCPASRPTVITHCQEQPCRLQGAYSRVRAMNHTDLNLLLGILAAHRNMVECDRLIRAMNAWVLERHGSLGEILVHQGALTPARRIQLEALVEEHLDAHGADADRCLPTLSVNTLNSLQEAIKAVGDPALHQTFARLVSGHAMITMPDPGATLAYGSVPAVSLAHGEDATAAAGMRFVVIRPHARGGIGQVSVALDRELDREVALKEILPEQADIPGSRSRFLLEAQITGRLEHPGVVPVYGLGYDASGRPFYAMRFVKGENLKEAISHFHQGVEGSRGGLGRWVLSLRQLLNRFIAVCNVVEYAHSRGIIHRDLKPSNILLGPYGETLVVDWGLAKAMGCGDVVAGTSIDE